MTDLVHSIEEALECWRTVPHFVNYEVSDAGRVRRIGTSGALRDAAHPRGYRTVCLYRSGRRFTRTVHSVVASAFMPDRPPDTEINHIDGNKANNRATNLEYLTGAQNKAHAVLVGLTLAGSANPSARLSSADVGVIRSLCRAGRSQRCVADMFGVSRGHVSNLVTGKKWPTGFEPEGTVLL